MPDLITWALRWGVSPDALRELEQMVTPPAPDTATPLSESAVQNLVRLEAAAHGTILWRNNVGACIDERGNQIRYGLANDSKKVNASLKSSDLIGIKPVLIEPRHVGHRIGQFVAREVKHSNWRYTGNPRERAQRVFIDLVLAYGGDAAFTTGEAQL